MQIWWEIAAFSEKERRGRKPDNGYRQQQPGNFQGLICPRLDCLLLKTKESTRNTFQVLFQNFQKLHIYGTFIRNWHIFLKVAHFSKTVHLSESWTFNLSKTAHLIYPKLHISPKMAHFPKATHLSENGRLIRKWHIYPKTAHLSRNCTFHRCDSFSRILGMKEMKKKPLCSFSFLSNKIYTARQI